MLKRDRIFFAACGLCAVGLVLLAIGFELGILCFVGAYLLRPVLHESGLATQYADEREMLIHSRSGNIAFIVMVLAAVGFALWRISRGQRADELYPLICIGLAARAITGLVMGGEYRRAGATIIGAFGIFFGLFLVLDAGFPWGPVIGLVPALVGVGLAWVALRSPRFMAAVLSLSVVLLVVGARLYLFRSNDTALWLFFVLPLCFAAACLFLGAGGEEREISSRTRARVFASLAAASAVVFCLLIVFGDRGVEDQIGGSTVSAADGEIVDVEGVPCTGFIDYYKNGNLQSCTLARHTSVAGQPLAAGTVVSFTPEGDFDWCFLQHDTRIQGHLCRGSGHNFMTGFHPDGTLRLAWLAEDEIIDGVPCARFTLLTAFLGDGGGTHFHENGRLSRATLSRPTEIQGQSFKKYDLVRFDEDGNLNEDQHE